MKLHIYIFIILAPLLGLSQTADSLIVKNLETKKEYVIQPWHKIVLTPKDDSLKTYGSIVKQSNDSIWIDAEMQEINISYSYPNRLRKPSIINSIDLVFYEENYDEFDYEYQKVIFSKDNCKYLKCDKTPLNRKVYQSLAILSLSALIISPIISINYKTWDFNTKNFLWVSGISMVSTTINFGLYKTVGVKRFNFGTGNYKIK